MKAKIEELEATCAAMREAIENINDVDSNGYGSPSDRSMAIDHALDTLAPSAGTALLERLKQAEARAVVPYIPKSFCRERCAYWKPELEGCGEWKKDNCEVRFFHGYLRDHGHIRESEAE